MSDPKYCSQCSCYAGAVDQYSDNVSPEVWDLCIGDHKKRTAFYRDFISKILRSSRCHRVLDVACGTGVDSVMLLEEGFRVTSVDLSYKMLKFARDIRWERRKEPAFDAWVMKEANWLTLTEDMKEDGLFDAVVCMGNSICALLDSSPDQALHKKALRNMAAMVRPGGVLVIDHLNCDGCLEKGGNMSHNIYYAGQGVKVTKVSLLFEDGRPCAVGRNYEVDVSNVSEELVKKYRKFDGQKWRTQIFPHRLADFQNLLREVFGPSAKYNVFGDFKPIDQIENPALYIHVVQKRQ